MSKSRWLIKSCNKNQNQITYVQYHMGSVLTKELGLYFCVHGNYGPKTDFGRFG